MKEQSQNHHEHSHNENEHSHNSVTESSTIPMTTITVMTTPKIMNLRVSAAGYLIFSSLILTAIMLLPWTRHCRTSAGFGQ